jgi:hypothetical protein
MVQREDHGTLAPLIIASRRIVVAWDIRGSSRVRYVSPARLAAFREELRIAEQILLEITSLEPDNAAAWNLSLTTGLGLQLGLDEARRRYEHVISQSPNDLTAQHSYLQQLCPRWGGRSFHEVHTFAREAFMTAPAGSQQGELVAMAHLEEGGHLPPARRARYFQQPDVRAELATAAERSVLHPQYRRGPTWPVGHNVFALAFSFAGEHAAAREQFRLLGATATLVPWADYFDDPEYGFEQARKSAQRKL